MGRSARTRRRPHAPATGSRFAPEVFSVADATKLATFAKSKGIGRIGMWSANRDSQMSGGPSRAGGNSSRSAGSLRIRKKR